MGDHERLGRAGEPRCPEEGHRSYAEAADSIWRITVGPLIWALHFAVSYAATAITCARSVASDAPLDTLRLALGVLTALALDGIARTAWVAWCRWGFLDDRDYEHDAATEEDRHEFIGHTQFLLAVISFIGVLYVAMPPLLLENCR